MPLIVILKGLFILMYIKIPRIYKTLEVIAVEAKVGRKDILFLGIYRLPKERKASSNLNYVKRVEEELNDICMWASTHKQVLVIVGDLNLPRIRLDA